MTQPKLQLTNGYEIDFGQIAQLLAAIERDGRGRIPVASLAETMGISYRQAENLGSIARALELATAKTYQLTRLAKLIIERDRFFDDLGTLWFLHYVVASDPRHLVWNQLTNEFLLQSSGFTRDEFRKSFHYLAESHSKDSASKHVLKEVNTTLNAYSKQHFARLAYIQETGEYSYVLSYREPIPPLVLAACIARYRAMHRPGDTAISVTDLLSAPNSPGVICQIPEDRLRAGLEYLKSEPGISLESRADLDQVRLTDATTDVEWLERYYARR